MKVLLITDIHGDTENLAKIISKEDFDAILCAGDLSDANKFDNYQAQLDQVLDIFEENGELVKAVPGNMDPEEDCVRSLIERRMNIHKKIGSFEKFEAVGFGGGITPFGTPFEPEGKEIKEAVSTLYQRMQSDTRVAVIHQPPADTKVDVANGEHVGSQEVRELLEQKDFDLLLTGHIHESKGKDEIEGTEVINPGPVLEGNYALAEIDSESLKLEMKSL